ncbi:MAG: hypothetical protein ACUVX8_14845 [Candidatus Zipacnadales bacterium]
MRSSWCRKLTLTEMTWPTAFGILAIVVITFWWPSLGGGMAPLLGDAQAHMLPWRAQLPPPQDARWDALLWDGMAQYFPWRTFAARMVKRGLIPLWNPHQFCGAPFLANGQSAILYPPTWLFFLVPVRYAFGLSAALHYFLAGGFMLLLLREFQVRPTAALSGAMAFMLGGFIVSWTALPTLMNTAAWLPGVAWSIERVRGKHLAADTLLIAGMLGLTLLAGHLQIAAYVWLFATGRSGVLVVRMLSERRGWRIVLPLIMGPLLGLLLASGQLLPTIELAQLSPRGEAAATEEGFRFRQMRALQPSMLVTLLSPNALGDPDAWSRRGLAFTEVCGYVGKLTLLLALVGFVAAWEERAFTYVVLAALALEGAMGGMIARVIYHGVPGMAQAGGFGRLLCLFTFGIAVCSGLGTEWLTRRLEKHGRSRPCHQFAPWLGLIAGAIICADLFSWARSFLPLSPRERIYPPTTVTSQLAQETGRWRVLAVTERVNWTISRRPEALLPPNAACAYGYDSVQGYDSLLPRVYTRFAAEVSPEGFTPAANGNMVLLDNPTAEALDWAAMRWLLVPASRPIYDPRYAERLRKAGVIVYENRNVLPRARLRTPEGAILGAELEPTNDPSRVICRLDSWTAGDFVLADTCYPGWRAYVDRRPARLELEAPAFRKVLTPEGAERVEMVYVPASFVAGMFVSLLALGAFGVLLSCHLGCGSHFANVDTNGLFLANIT